MDDDKREKRIRAMNAIDNAERYTLSLKAKLSEVQHAIQTMRAREQPAHAAEMNPLRMELTGLLDSTFNEIRKASNLLEEVMR